MAHYSPDITLNLRLFPQLSSGPVRRKNFHTPPLPCTNSLSSTSPFKPLIHSSPVICQHLYSVCHCHSFQHLCFHFPCFCFSHFLFARIWIPPVFPAEWRQYIDEEMSLDKLLSLSMSVSTPHPHPPPHRSLVIYLPRILSLLTKDISCKDIFVQLLTYLHPSPPPRNRPPLPPAVRRCDCPLRLQKKNRKDRGVKWNTNKCIPKRITQYNWGCQLAIMLLCWASNFPSIIKANYLQRRAQ